jgi:hypothetical protein
MGEIGERSTTSTLVIRLAVDAEPADPMHRLVLADACEEIGDTITAVFWRWTVTVNIYPQCRHADAWIWWPQDDDRHGPSCLPLGLFFHLSDMKPDDDGLLLPSAPAAWDALLVAWRACVAAGIDPRIIRRNKSV